MWRVSSVAATDIGTAVDAPGKCSTFSGWWGSVMKPSVGSLSLATAGAVAVQTGAWSYAGRAISILRGVTIERLVLFAAVVACESGVNESVQKQVQGG